MQMRLIIECTVLENVSCARFRVECEFESNSKHRKLNWSDRNILSYNSKKFNTGNAINLSF